MDPVHTLRILREALDNGEDPIVYDMINDLFEWINKGGFIPSEAHGLTAALRDAEYLDLVDEILSSTRMVKAFGS